MHLARKSKTLIMEVRGLASSTANSLIRQVGALLTRFPPPSEKPETGWQAGKVGGGEQLLTNCGVYVCMRVCVLIYEPPGNILPSFSLSPSLCTPTYLSIPLPSFHASPKMKINRDMFCSPSPLCPPSLICPIASLSCSSPASPSHVPSLYVFWVYIYL